MNISKEQIDALNAVLTVSVTKEDYEDKVKKVLTDYKKNANIPGFRKGHVPMGMIQKQYGKAVLFDEVNKLVQENLNNYLTEEKLNILGNPLPKEDKNFDWDAENFNFDFELGLTPEFSVDLEGKTKVKQFEIIADEAMIDNQVGNIQKQYGKMIPQEKVALEHSITGTFTNEEKQINNTTTFTLDVFKDKKTAKQFVDKKVGDVIQIETKGLFDDDHKLMDYLKISHDDVHNLDIVVDFKIEEINAIEKAELNQELFDKLFGEGKVTSIEELKTKIKEESEAGFKQQANQKFLDDVVEELIETTKFELPSAFLKRWIATAGEKPLTAVQAEEEYNKSEKGLRYQLIEAKIASENNIQLSLDDLKAHTSTLIRKQMAQFGQLNPSDEEVEGIVARILSNQDEVKRLSEQIMSEKLLSLFKEKVKAKTKKVNYQEFVKEMYGE